jgi:hypothetical protein
MTPANSGTKELTELEHLCEEYKAYLRYQRGLSEATIESCMGYTARFMTFRFGKGDVIGLTMSYSNQPFRKAYQLHSLSGATAEKRTAGYLPASSYR